MTDLEKARANQREAKFSPGDVVKVRGSSVLMTINSVNTQNQYFKEDGSSYQPGQAVAISFNRNPDLQEFSGSYNCIWFDQDVHVQSRSFDEEVLVHIPDNEVP